jgi:hypothetical protein
MLALMRVYFAGVGGASLVLALWLLRRRLRVWRQGASAMGRVVSFESRIDDESTSYLPVIAFVDQRGQEQRFTSVAGRSHRTPPVGSGVRVRYLRDSPGTAFIASFLHMWAAPLALAVLGAAAIVASLRG